MVDKNPDWLFATRIIGPPSLLHSWEDYDIFFQHLPCYKKTEKVKIANFFLLSQIKLTR